MVRWVVLLVCCALVTPVWGDSKGWSSPAAGESLSGDIEILFTFDDGPSPTFTPQILDILAVAKIHAVFFLVGDRVKDNPKKAVAIIARILREGHIIANHTMSHLDLCRVKEEERAVRDIDEGKSVIEEAAGITVQWFRVPYGVRCERLDRLLAERHLEHFHWDLDPQEWRGRSVQKTVDYITGQLARSHGRTVLLLHDMKAVTVKALPQILAWIDVENAKRARSHKRKIRFLDAPALALERMPGFADWFLEATADLRNLPGSIASALP